MHMFQIDHHSSLANAEKTFLAILLTVSVIILPSDTMSFMAYWYLFSLHLLKQKVEVICLYFGLIPVFLSFTFA